MLIGTGFSQNRAEAQGATSSPAIPLISPPTMVLKNPLREHSCSSSQRDNLSRQLFNPERKAESTTQARRGPSAQTNNLRSLGRALLLSKVSNLCQRPYFQINCVPSSALKSSMQCNPNASRLPLKQTTIWSYLHQLEAVKLSSWNLQLADSFHNSRLQTSKLFIWL
jgi:hypothetical protein